jgi:hypothetical protein
LARYVASRTIVRGKTAGLGARFKGLAMRRYCSSVAALANVTLLGADDSSVRFLKNTIDPKIFKAMGTPNGGEPVARDHAEGHYA